jgi:hypothetical protein
VLFDLLDYIDENDLDPEGIFDKHDLLRFCRARNFVLEDVQLMFKNCI